MSSEKPSTVPKTSLMKAPRLTPSRVRVTGSEVRICGRSRLSTVRTGAEPTLGPDSTRGRLRPPWSSTGSSSPAVSALGARSGSGKVG